MARLRTRVREEVLVRMMAGVCECCAQRAAMGTLGGDSQKREVLCEREEVMSSS